MPRQDRTAIGYPAFLNSKRFSVPCTGIDVSPSDINPILFLLQRDVTVWALKKGRAALFLDTGLGKTFCQLEWARLISSRKALIVAPLSVARQTVREATKLGLTVKYCRSQVEATERINITNYEMLEAFDPAEFDAVVLDESSILKSMAGKTKAKLVEMFRKTPYRLCCSATPAPNDIAEIANHTAFLGHMTREEMLATFFVHDDEGWRLRGWANEGPFYQWLATWAMSVQTPSNLGYPDDGYILPALNITPVFVKAHIHPEDQLFFAGLKGVGDRASVRKKTTDARIEKAIDIIGDSQEQWLIWCGTDAEADGINRQIGYSINVKGPMKAEQKAKAIEDFQDGIVQRLITKPKIAGAGLNLQNCHNMIFLGLSDSYEAYYQCIRRCYRFGQKEPVNAYVVLSDAEQGIYQNVLRKEEEAKKMSEKLIEHVSDYETKELHGMGLRVDYGANTDMVLPHFLS